MTVGQKSLVKQKSAIVNWQHDICNMTIGNMAVRLMAIGHMKMEDNQL